MSYNFRNLEIKEGRYIFCKTEILLLARISKTLIYAGSEVLALLCNKRNDISIRDIIQLLNLYK